MRCLEPPDPVTGTPAFVQCAAEHLQQTTKDWSQDRREASELVLVTQAYRALLNEKSPEYRQKFSTDAAKIAQTAGWTNHQAAFIEAPETEGERWSQPSLKEVVGVLKAAESTDIVCFASGFPLDGVEVEFDLDEITAQACADANITFTRVPAIRTSNCAAMVAESIERHLPNSQIRNPRRPTWRTRHSPCFAFGCLQPDTAARLWCRSGSCPPRRYPPQSCPSEHTHRFFRTGLAVDGAAMAQASATMGADFLEIWTAGPAMAAKATCATPHSLRRALGKNPKDGSPNGAMILVTPHLVIGISDQPRSSRPGSAAIQCSALRPFRAILRSTPI